jgi:hypothetical protein
MKINLDQQTRRVKIEDLEIQNNVVFSFFDKLSIADRTDHLTRAIYIGVLALMENRIASFLAKTSNELGTELESLKLLFDMKKELFFLLVATDLVQVEDLAQGFALRRQAYHVHLTKIRRRFEEIDENED